MNQKLLCLMIFSYDRKKSGGNAFEPLRFLNSQHVHLYTLDAEAGDHEPDDLTVDYCGG